MEKPRQIAARILQRYDAGQDYLDHLLEDELGRTPLRPEDRGLCQELIFGVVRWQSALDALIDRKAIRGQPRELVRRLLRLGLYQMFWLDRIPMHAAVHETVEMGKQLGAGAQAGFINALLRSYARERSTTRRWLEELKIRQPALAFSHPEWMCQRWGRRWGHDAMVRLLTWNNTPPPLYARLNSLRTEPAHLLARWREEGVKAIERGWSWTGESLVFELKEHPPLGTLPSLQQGLFYVQDPSTLLAVQELDPQPGETVLDVCAAPGGKTTFIAQLMQNRGRIIAWDMTVERRRQLEDNCTRLGASCVRTTEPLKGNARLMVPVDRVLVDAPCSNTGVMRRRVEVRRRLRMEELERLARSQLEILGQAIEHLRPGGLLVYSTCSLEPEENAELIHRLVAGRPELRVENERELLPFVDGVDGAYVARVRRVEEPV